MPPATHPRPNRQNSSLPAQPNALLIIADSERDADLLYATGLLVPDPFIFLRTEDAVHLVLNDLEIDRAARDCPEAIVHSGSQLRSCLGPAGAGAPKIGHLAGLLLADLRINQVNVPQTFPLGVANAIQEIAPETTFVTVDPFLERRVKSGQEIGCLKEILRITQEGLAAGISLIRDATIGREEVLIRQGSPLTAECVRGVIDSTVASLGALPGHTIVACGDQGCDPHERGHGTLKAHRPIIVDVFPRSVATGYHGDLTRTVVKGRASEALQRLHQAVKEAQTIAFEALRPGVEAREVHRNVANHFRDQGFETGRRNDHMQGFFHGTGHGLGLELHEAPAIGKNSPDRLQSGNVVTVEPGLYYPGIGGVRIEDVVLIGGNGSSKLSFCEQPLEI